MKPNPKPEKKQKKSKAIPIEIVAEVFARDECRCQKCGILTAGLEPDSQLQSAHCHHKKHKSQGGENTVDNLETVCWSCHFLEHN